jgi:hypothetical protein
MTRADHSYFCPDGAGLQVPTSRLTKAHEIRLCRAWLKDARRTRSRSVTVRASMALRASRVPCRAVAWRCACAGITRGHAPIRIITPRSPLLTPFYIRSVYRIIIIYLIDEITANISHNDASSVPRGVRRGPYVACRLCRGARRRAGGDRRGPPGAVCASVYAIYGTRCTRPGVTRLYLATKYARSRHTNLFYRRSVRDCTGRVTLYLHLSRSAIRWQHRPAWLRAASAPCGSGCSVLITMSLSWLRIRGAPSPAIRVQRCGAVGAAPSL